MGLLGWLAEFLGLRRGGAPVLRVPGDAGPGAQGRGGAGGRSVEELCRRLEMTEAQLRATPITYTAFQVQKRRGKKKRTLHAPGAELKLVQRRILRRVLATLAAHPAAVGFERGHSIATNAAFHGGRAVVVRMDIRDFFPSTTRERVEGYFRAIGWDEAAARLLADLTTHEGRLPQGAPTSPRLSNLVNRRLDDWLQGWADSLGARYTRYADDMTFSFEADDQARVHRLIGGAKLLVESCGYQLHMKEKLHVRRRGDRQVVTGLVVNGQMPPRLPRERRRLLRAIRHRAGVDPKAATLTPAQLAGWASLEAMIRSQGGPGGGAG